MLYIVATPIGNLEEITFRAVDVLKSVDVIAAEDTRHTMTLLSRYGIKNKLITYQRFNEKQGSKEIIELLESGKNVALVSDAGMPLVSDPGFVLIKELCDRGLKYTVISGPCAAVSALVLSGMDTTAFAMLGFLPEKNIDKDRLIEKYKNLECTLIFYSAPHDIKKHLDYLFSQLGARRIAVVREISKIHEEVIQMRLGEQINFVQKGEMVIVVEGKDRQEDFENLSIYQHYKSYIDIGTQHNEALKKVAFDRKISKSIIYKEVLSHTKE